VHPLDQALRDAVAGRFPTVDGGVDVFEPDGRDTHAVVEFTGHAFVLTDREPAGLVAQGVDGFGGVTQPDVLRWLAGPGGWIGSLDAVLVATGRGGGGLPTRDDLDEHPRVRRARAHRTDVRVYGDDAGFVTLGAGLVGRCELSVELLASDPPELDRRRSGEGRRLISEALGVTSPGQLVWAQVAPGNAASLRAFLSCGFVPICAEVLLKPSYGVGATPPLPH
jgi:hypothetical protein